MTEIQDDYQFLEEIAQRNKDWKRFQKQKASTEVVKRHKKASSFLLHPKRLSSDSDSDVDEKFSTSTTIKADLFKDHFKKIQENSLAPLHDNNNDKTDFLMEKMKMGTKTYNENSATAKSSKENIMKPKQEHKGILKHNSVNEKDFNKFISDNNMPKKRVKPRTAQLQVIKIDHFDKKFRNLVEKILKIVKKIKVILEKGIPPPDGEEDFQRRTKRSQEFSARFSRVYLYPLLRQMNELHNSEKTNVTLWTTQKILSIHQIIWQGLQAYYNHLPTSIGKCNSDKLQNLLDQSLDICQFQQDLTNIKDPENDEFINAMKSHVELLLETLTTFDLKMMEKKSKHKNENFPPKRTGTSEMRLKSRLSMYSVTSAFRRDADWKRSVDLLAKKKYNVKSRYRTASFKHRPPVEKLELIEIKPKAIQNKSGMIKESPIVERVPEDEIVTMVELNVPVNSVEILNHGSSKQLVRDCDLDNGSIVEENNFPSPIHEKIVDDKSSENLIQKSSKEKIISVTGTKNAKLICMRYDSPLIESEIEKVKDKEIMTDKVLNSSQTQTTLERTKTRSCIKISRIPKTPLRTLEMLPKDNAINIIQYKLLYHNYHKNNPMYKKTVHIQPWILMGRISDDLLNEILQSVTRELEVNEILENLYNTEFQY